jgi:hypothetical protein
MKEKMNLETAATLGISPILLSVAIPTSMSTVIRN